MNNINGSAAPMQSNPCKSELRAQFNQENRAKLRNRDFTLLASNCNGAFLLHDLGLKFRTPTVNLWLEPGDYLEFLTHLEQYLGAELEFDSELEERYRYPVGVLGGRVRLYFQHYRTREAARDKWQERAKRVDLNNLFIWCTDRDGCTYEDIQRFDALPYENKVIFTHVPYPEFKSAFYIRGFEQKQSVGLLFAYESGTSVTKYYDQFPYIDWFNGETADKG